MNRNLLFSRISLFATSLLAVAFAGHISAQEPAVPSRPISAALNWSGFYFGGNVGGIFGDYDFGDSSIDVPLRRPMGGGTTIVTVDVPAFDASSGGDFVGGVQAGYNRQFGSLVFGLEGDATGLSLNASRSFSLNSADLDVAGLSAKREASSDWMITGRVRAGYAWNRFLFYLTGGLAISDIIVDVNDFYSPAVRGTQSSSDDTVIVGWTAGGGAEFAVSDAVSMAVEYRHADFGDQSFNFSSDSRFNVHSTRVNLAEDQVTLRVNIRVDSLFHR